MMSCKLINKDTMRIGSEQLSIAFAQAQNLMQVSRTIITPFLLSRDPQRAVPVICTGTLDMSTRSSAAAFPHSGT